MASKKIYKMRAWYIDYEGRKGDKRVVVKDYKEEVYIGFSNLKYAKHAYERALQEFKFNEQYGKSVVVELFEPEVHSDGMLAYYPSRDRYILRYKTGES